jgi:hypothetical protein
VKIRRFAKKDSFRTLNTLADMVIRAEDSKGNGHE